MKKTTANYLRQLGFWLRYQGVEGPRIVTILLDVRTHVAESGEDPYETFGEPRAYAKAFAEGSRRRWFWGASLVVAVAGFVASTYLFACALASHSDARPLPLGGLAWVVIALAFVAALVAWRAFLVVVVRPLSALAYDESEASTSWRGWKVHRRYTTVAVVLALVAGSVLWGHSLGRSFLNAPQLRASDYVWALAGDSPPSLNPFPESVTVSTVIYLAAPGPTTQLGRFSLSRDQNRMFSVSSNIVPYPTLASAVLAAHNHNFSGIDNNAPSTTLKYGTFYLIEYFGEVTLSLGNLSPAESLNIHYSVDGSTEQVLKIGLPLNFESDN